MALKPETHAKHHAKVDQLIADVKTAKDKRRASGYAAAILAQHLRAGHRWRHQGPPLGLADLRTIHDRLHENDG